MLKTNLSTRPFYNERAVHLILGALGATAVVVLAVGVVQLVGYQRELSTLTVAADQDERSAAAIADQVVEVRRGTSDGELQALAASAQQANQLIDRRVFSWTEFFNRIELTLPPTVVLESVRPEVDQDGVIVTIGVRGREVEEVDAFIEELESTGAFVDVLAREQEMTEDGTYRALLAGRYFSDVGGHQVGEAGTTEVSR
jgi:hypothetical protein